MSRASWLFLGVAVLLGACANGSEEINNIPGEGGVPGADATTAGGDATSGSEDGGSLGEDSGGNTGEDSGSVTSEDSGEDAGTEDSSTAEDAGETDSSAEKDAEADSSTGHDSGTADAGHDSGIEDAGHDSGTVTDAGHDSGTTTDAGQDSGTTVDAGVDSGNPVDAGDDAPCSPPVTPVFTETFHPPATSGSCTSTQVTNFYNACFAGSATACSTWQGSGSNSSCNTCLTGSSSPTGTNWGPLVYYSVSGIDELDLGGCLYYDPDATGSVSNQISCSDDLEYLMECEHAACDVSCSTSQNGYGACATEADDDASLCQSEYNAVYGASSPCASVGSECFQGTTFESALADVAKVMCE